MMFGILKRLSQVLLVITGIAIYFYQIYLWYLLGEYLGVRVGIEANIFALFGAFPLWLFIPYGIHALVSWIIAGKIYTIKEYKKLYKKIIKQEKIILKGKAQKQAGNLSIVEKDDTGGLSIL